MLVIKCSFRSWSVKNAIFVDGLDGCAGFDAISRGNISYDEDNEHHSLQ
jgi:hypothetical protein